MSHPMYGRVHAPEPPSALLSLHLHDGSTLREVDHETPLAVLDQSDLPAQGIHTSHFIRGCKSDAQALGSCVPNTGVEAAATVMSEQEFVAFCRNLISESYVDSCRGFSDAKGAERAAIALYQKTTAQTGNTAEEWPPTDCGSSGVYLFNEMYRLGAISGQQIAHAGEDLISLMQDGLVLTGSPWFYAWEEPDAQGFIDGDGTPEALSTAIKSGVAGGHETSLVAIETLVLTGTGKVDPSRTILRSRNHWTPGWGDHGCFRTHLSTWVMLGGQCDFRRFVR